jgi:hypothetical protein
MHLTGCQPPGAVSDTQSICKDLPSTELAKTEKPTPSPPQAGEAPGGAGVGDCSPVF